MIKYIYALYYYLEYRKTHKKVRIKRAITGTLYVLVKNKKGWRDRVRISDHKRKNKNGNRRKTTFLTGKLEHDIIINNIFDIEHLRKR